MVSVFIGLGDVQVRAGPAHVTAVASKSVLDLDLPNAAPGPVMPARENPVGGNPVWAVPLSALSETIARPLFSPSRRPPPPPAVAAPDVPTAKPPPPAKPDRPSLILLGTIVGRSEAIAIFLDEASQGVIRLKVGQAHGDWILGSVRGRIAKLQKGGQLATLSLPSPAPKASDQLAHVDAAVAALAGNGPLVDRLPGRAAIPVMPALPAASQTKEPFRRTPREL